MALPVSTMPGPVATAFLYARGTVQAFNGPVGGGKTTTMMLKAARVMPIAQPPSPIDGIRRRVVTVVHVDYRKLWRGPVQTWWNLFPQDTPFGKWTGGKDDPAEHQLQYLHPIDKGPIHLTMRFIAIGDNVAEDVMRGYETTDWLLMEADLLDEDVFTYAMTRLARAPGRKHGDVVNPYVGLDFNAPEFDSWVFERMTTEWEENGRLFRQPPAAFEPTPGQFVINEKAENRHNLDTGYYPRIIEELKRKDVDLVRRFVCNQPGFSKHGLAVYAEDYDDHYHVAKNELVPEPRLPLYLGMDAGGDPSAILFQVHADGQVRVLHELISRHGTGPERFGENLNELLASPRFHAFQRSDLAAWSDPSAFYGGDAEADNLNDKDWATKVRAKTGIPIRPAELANGLNPRLQAVRDKLRWPNSYPGLLLCPRHCPMLRKGFMRGYHYGEIKRANTGGTHSHHMPVKNEFSHPHDALQYGIQGAAKYPRDGPAPPVQLRAVTNRNTRGDWGSAQPRALTRRQGI